MKKTLNRLQKLFPELTFVSAKSFYWSPASQEIFYDNRSSGLKAIWSLFHETSHALLAHQNYGSDFELIRLEIEAWEKAQQLATTLGTKIDQEHIEDCLDTYRDWLYKRSICPSCTTKCLQQSNFSYYRCFNCHSVWKVSASRFCRTYRTSHGKQKPSAVFSLTDGSKLKKASSLSFFSTTTDATTFSTC